MGLQPHREQRDWTEGQLELLRVLWDGKGFSASEIARQIFADFGVHRSRSAICGKVRRIGLTRRCNSRVDAAHYAVRSTKIKKGRRTSRTTPVNKATVKHKSPSRYTFEEPIAPLNTPLASLEWGMCRAVSDASTWGQPLYCGHACGETESYCAAHKARFFQPEKPRVRHASEQSRADRARYRDSARWAGL